MLQCPWCNNHVQLINHICPECKHEVLPEHLNAAPFNESNQSEDDSMSNHIELSLDEMIINQFRCSKCKHDECNVKEVAMTGTGLSKMFDIQHNHFLFVSCTNCSFTEIYDPDVLRGHKSGQIGTILDVLFGG